MFDNPLARAIEPGIRYVVDELGQLGWKGVVGSRYDVPYVRVIATGCQIRLMYNQNQSLNQPFSEAWLWYASRTNFERSWSGEFQGFIPGMGDTFDPETLLFASQALLFDPCAIQNACIGDDSGWPILNSWDQIDCPVCSPDKEARLRPEGVFDPVFGSFERGSGLFQSESYQQLLSPVFYER
jgi:hypothetical protein